MPKTTERKTDDIKKSCDGGKAGRMKTTVTNQPKQAYQSPKDHQR